MGKRIVLALGGNALGSTAAEQLVAVRHAASIMADLIAEGHQLIVGHGNGPQVGMIQMALDYAAKNNVTKAPVPLVECVAMSQGYIAYHIQQAIQMELKKRGIKKEVASVVTQMKVDINDPAFSNPAKPVGMFYTKEEADALSAKDGSTFVEDSGRGYRKVVPSPMPLEIVEIDAVRKMLAEDMVVVTVGGGGIPVVEKDGELVGVDAVIDKDQSCSRLAADVEADALLILTAVDRVCINFNKPNQQALAEMSLADCEKYIAEGHFAPGSMLPKVEACMRFVQGKPGGSAIITSLERASDALRGETGTRVHA